MPGEIEFSSYINVKFLRTILAERMPPCLTGKSTYSEAFVHPFRTLGQNVRKFRLTNCELKVAYQGKIRTNFQKSEVLYITHLLGSKLPLFS